MIIESSNISMFSRHDLFKKHEKKEALRMWVGNQRPDFEGRGQLTEQQPPVKVKITNLPANGTNAQPVTEEAPGVVTVSPKDNMKIKLIEAMIKALTGKDIKIMTPEIRDPNSVSHDAAVSPQGSDAPAQERQGWGLEYDYHESYKEQETMSFKAGGIIKTQDGKEINFTAQLTMNRQFMIEHNINIREGDAKKIDPLVINFGGSAAQLTDAKYSFDLDSDGREDKVSFVGPGSGFLAFDINGDGGINNGSELFGPSTGSGFAELSKYDDDNNQWIDERDSIFEKLKIWTKDSDGEDRFSTLADKGIGAIYLGNILTQFEIKNSENESYGEVRNSGIYIAENGTAGTLQQIDLTV